MSPLVQVSGQLGQGPGPERQNSLFSSSYLLSLLTSVVISYKSFNFTPQKNVSFNKELLMA